MQLRLAMRWSRHETRTSAGAERNFYARHEGLTHGVKRLERFLQSRSLRYPLRVNYVLQATTNPPPTLFARLRPQRVAVVRALYLGDMLCTVPAFRALRDALPGAHIALVSLPWARELARRYDREFNEFIEFPGCPGLPERDVDAERLESFRQAMHAARFDVIIQMHGSGRYINSFVQQLGARATAGFYLEDDDLPQEVGHRWTDAYIRYPSDQDEAHRHLQLVKRLSGRAIDDALPHWPLSDDDLREADELLGTDFERRDLAPICLHPGARYLSRRWPVERFAEVGNRLGREGWPIVITGSAAEKALGRALSDALHVPHRCLTGSTSLGGLFGVASRASLVITNDTGMSHVAAAVRTPSVVLHLGSDARRWAPLDGRRHRLVSAPVDCRPCEYRDCPIGHVCAYNLSIDEVVAAARRQLDDYPLTSHAKPSTSIPARS